MHNKYCVLAEHLYFIVEIAFWVTCNWRDWDILNDESGHTIQDAGM